MTRALRLARETLADLTPDDLAAVAGGAYDAPPTWYLQHCLSIDRVCLGTGPR